MQGLVERSPFRHVSDTYVLGVILAKIFQLYTDGTVCYEGDVFPLTQMLGELIITTCLPISLTTDTAPFERDYVPSGWSAATVTLKSVENGKRGDVCNVLEEIQPLEAGEEIMM